MTPTLGRQVVPLCCLLLAAIALCAQANGAAASEVDTMSKIEIANLAATLASPAGLCSTKPVSIIARNLADVSTRLKYPNTTTVIIYLRRNIVTFRSILLNASYSCTIFLGSPVGKYAISYPGDDRVALRIWGANNILFHGINFANIINHAATTGCKGIPDFGTWGNAAPVCPTLHIWQSHSIQITTGVLTGRLDLFRSTNCRIDSMTFRNAAGGSLNPSNLRTGYLGSAAELELSNNVISNNRFTGTSVGLLLYYGTVGVTVSNNEFTNYDFTAILCGNGIHFVADCMLNTMTNNVITFATSGPRKPAGDSGGIYFDCHWVNPENKLSCNYVINGQHCIYSDYLTSGLMVESAVCIHTQDGIKMNGGHYNQVNNMVLVNNSQQAGWISCQNFGENNCLKDPGTFWEAARLQYYNSFRWRKYWPYLTSFCSAGAYDGVSCNPAGGEPASATGACSGIPVGNSIQLTVVAPKSTVVPSGYRFCDTLPSVPQLNSVKEFTFPTVASAGFTNAARGDYSIKRTSSIRHGQPHFQGCPRANAGVKPVKFNTFLAAFNAVPGPAHAATLAARLVRVADFERVAYEAAGFNATSAAEKAVAAAIPGTTASVLGRMDQWPNYLDLGKGLTKA